MASSYVHPVARFHAPRFKFRPKMAVAPRVTVRRPGEGVTAIRTAGVEGPTIAPPTAPLHHSTTPRLHTPPVEPPLRAPALIREAIDTALDSVELLERQARDVSRRFRRGALGDANLGLAHLVQSTQTLLRLADMTAGASGTDIESLCDARGLTAPEDTDAAVSRLIREQLAEDWPALAEVLDHPFLGALAGWRLVFEALDGPSTGPYGTAA